ncbi:MAG: Gx transporter family protein [Candidatus Fimimonas sp.]
MLAVLCAMGLIMFMVESLFPPLFLPGAKMGLSNIFSMLAVFLLGPVDALTLVVVRTLLGSMFTGNMSTLMYSMTAGVVSVLVSSLLVETVYPKVSIVAVSVVSAVMHNVTQNVVFCLVSNTPEMFSYMPWLALLGVVAGIIVGFAVWFILKTVPLKLVSSVLGASEKDFAAAMAQQAQQTQKQQPRDEVAENTTEKEISAEQTTDEQPKNDAQTVCERTFNLGSGVTVSVAVETDGAVCFNAENGRLEVTVVAQNAVVDLSVNCKTKVVTDQKN